MDALIFDVDGTLWDSTEKVAVAWRQVCEREGVPSDMITPERLKKEFGKTLENIGYSLFPFLPKEEAVRVSTTRVVPVRFRSTPVSIFGLGWG